MLNTAPQLSARLDPCLALTMKYKSLDEEDPTMGSDTTDENSALLSDSSISQKQKSKAKMGLSWWIIAATALSLLLFLVVHQAKKAQAASYNTTAPETTTTITTFNQPVADDEIVITNCPRGFRRKITDVPFVGDYARPGFAEKRDENLVLCEAFDAPQKKEAWRADKTLFGEGNWGFAYYTPDNIKIQDGSLHIFPGLFEDLGNVTSKDGITRPAKDVMTDNCTPWPECATFSIVDENCTIADFFGCERVATPDVVLNPVTSGRLTTEGQFNMLYGRVEVRMRLPQGDWLWPAFWMMPVNASRYGGGWPDSGEFDILESKGNDPHKYGRTGGGRNLFSSCLHYNGNSWWKTRNFVSATDVIEVCRNGTVPLDECDWSTDFFTIGLYWSPDRIYAYALRDLSIDGEIVQDELKIWEVDASKGFGPNDYPLGMNYPPFSNEENTPNQNPQGPYVDESPNKNAPFDEPFYIIINLSVGGDINGCPSPGYWGPAAIWCTHRDPHHNQTARTVFWNNRDLWYPSWQEAKENQRETFAIDWIKAWQ